MGKVPLYTSSLAHWLTGDHATLIRINTCGLCSDAELMRKVRQRYDV